MDNRNIFNPQQQTQNGYYPYYQTAATMMRPDPASFLMPQAPSLPIIKGRPVSSLEEARVAQIDLDGSISIFPDFGNKKIYTKRINTDGTASLQSYSLDEQAPEAIPEYATRDEVLELKQTLEEVIERLKATSTQNVSKTQTPKLNF